MIDEDWSNSKDIQEQRRGGIAATLCQATVVERCFVSGKIVSGKKIYFTGIAAGDSSCTIRQCALGQFENVCKTSFIGFVEKLDGRISSVSAVSAVSTTSASGGSLWPALASSFSIQPTNLPKLENNAAIDSHAGTDDSNGVDGSSVAAVRFTQRYFENTLHWDFDTVWQWDAANERPALRAVGCRLRLLKTKRLGLSALRAVGSGAAVQQNLLTAQMRANIWL